MARRQPKPDPNQLRLDYEGSYQESMAALRGRLRSLTETITGLTAARLENLRQLLLAVYAHSGARPERYAQAAPDRLHATAELSRSVFSRARRDAVELGLLTAERPRVRRGERRPPDRLQLQHDQIEALVQECRLEAARPPESTPPRSGGPLPGAGPPGSGGTSRDQPGLGGIRWDHNKETHGPSYPPTLKPSFPVPTSASPVEARPPGEPDGRTEVLVSMGVLRRNAERLARAFAGTLDDLQAIAEVYRSKPGAWGPGAVVKRLEWWEPGQDPSEHWPAVDDAWAARQQTERRTEAVAAAASRRRRSDAERDAAVAERLGQLQLWQALSRDEQEAILDEQRPGWRSLGLPASAATFAVYTPLQEMPANG